VSDVRYTGRMDTGFQVAAILLGPMQDERSRLVGERALPASDQWRSRSALA